MIATIGYYSIRSSPSEQELTDEDINICDYGGGAVELDRLTRRRFHKYREVFRIWAE
jgi:hypothetical protein